jgi:hypothetical protein
VAELLDGVTHGAPLRRAVLESQTRAIAEIRATDFGALLRDRLAPVIPRSSTVPGDEGSAVPPDRASDQPPETALRNQILRDPATGGSRR